MSKEKNKKSEAEAASAVNAPVIGTDPLRRDDVAEYIICAAIWYKDGKQHDHQPKNIESGYVLCGRRHHNCIANHFIFGDEIKMEHVQGFLTSKDKFLNREDSAKIANKAGQTLVNADCLFSEHLY